MSLSCYCDDYDPEPGEWGYYPPDKFSTLQTTRRQRCTSCNELIDIGADCGEITRYRTPATDIEIKIYDTDGEINIASHYMCEECTGLYFALDDLGYCASLYENQHDLIAEYNELQAENNKIVVCPSCGWSGKFMEVDNGCPGCEKFQRYDRWGLVIKRSWHMVDAAKLPECDIQRRHYLQMRA